MTTARTAFDAVAEEYAGAFQAPQYLAENELVFAQVREELAQVPGTAPARVLDVGCGAGLALDYVHVAPEFYRGVDISPRMLQQARARHPEHVFERGSQEFLETVGSGSQDFVLNTFGSFSYSTESVRALAAMHRVLRKSGRFYLMAFQERYHGRTSHILHGKDVPIVTYSPEELGKLLGYAGFWDIRVSGFRGVPDYYLEGLPLALCKALLMAESATVARWRPSSMYFAVARGRR